MSNVRSGRQVYIDNLRLVVIVLVILVHLAVTYSGIGDWYYKEGRPLDTSSTVLFGFFQSFTQAYFMGLLFLISGYFVPSSCDRKGLIAFIRDRFVRLGLPVLLYMLVISPFMLYVLLDLSWLRPKPDFLTWYSRYVTTTDAIQGSGPLWFALALLVFSVIYALLRTLRSHTTKDAPLPLPGTLAIVGLILLISTLAFVIRLSQPIGTAVLNMQLSFFSQYVILFTIGILAYRNNWFETMPHRAARAWLRLATGAAPIFWLVMMLAGGALSGKFDLFMGGPYWQSAAYALWESTVAVSMAIGLIGHFRERLNHQSGLVKVLSDNAFAVYVTHPMVIVTLSQVARPIMFPPIIKFLLAAAIGIPLCFALAHFVVRKIPVVNRVL